MDTFAPTSGLYASLADLLAARMADGYMDHVRQIGVSTLPTSEITDPVLLSQLAQLNIDAVSTLTLAQRHADTWIVGGSSDAIDDQVQNVGAALARFGSRFVERIPRLAGETEGGALHQLQRLADEGQQALTKLERVKPSIDAFQTSVATDHANFTKLYAERKAMVPQLTQAHTKLEAKLADLEVKLQANNDQLTQKAISAGIDDLEAGVLAITAAAEEDFPEAIKQGLTFAYTTLKFEVEAVILEFEALKLVEEIIALRKEIAQIEVGLMFLRDTGSQLDTLRVGTLRVASMVDAGATCLRGVTMQLAAVVNGKAKLPRDLSGAIAGWTRLTDALNRVAAWQPSADAPIWTAANLGPASGTTQPK